MSCSEHPRKCLPRGRGRRGRVVGVADAEAELVSRTEQAFTWLDQSMEGPFGLLDAIPDYTAEGLETVPREWFADWRQPV